MILRYLVVVCVVFIFNWKAINMTTKLFSIRRKFTVVSAFNNSVHCITAKNSYNALAQGRKWFGHQCYLA